MGCIDFKELLGTQYAKCNVPEKEHSIYVNVWIPGRALTIKKCHKGSCLCEPQKSEVSWSWFSKKEKHLGKIR